MRSLTLLSRFVVRPTSSTNESPLMKIFTVGLITLLVCQSVCGQTAPSAKSYPNAKIRVAEGVLVGQAAMIGVSNDRGEHWTFVDSGKASNREQLKMLFPAVAGRLKLPAEKPPVLERTPPIKTSITIDSTTLSKDKPVNVTITVENISGQEFDLNSSCSFDLKNLSKESLTRKYEVIGDRYWGPVNISTGTRKELTIIDPEKQKQGITVGRVPQESIHFAKDETKTFKVDLAQLLWNPVMSSIFPNETLFKVVRKGEYALSLSCGNRTVNVDSNAIDVSVK